MKILKDPPDLIMPIRPGMMSKIVSCESRKIKLNCIPTIKPQYIYLYESRVKGAGRVIVRIDKFKFCEEYLEIIEMLRINRSLEDFGLDRLFFQTYVNCSCEICGRKGLTSSGMMRALNRCMDCKSIKTYGAVRLESENYKEKNINEDPLEIDRALLDFLKLRKDIDMSYQRMSQMEAL